MAMWERLSPVSLSAREWQVLAPIRGNMHSWCLGASHLDTVSCPTGTHHCFAQNHHILPACPWLLQLHTVNTYIQWAFSSLSLAHLYELFHLHNTFKPILEMSTLRHRDVEEPWLFQLRNWGRSWGSNPWSQAPEPGPISPVTSRQESTYTPQIHRKCEWKAGQMDPLMSKSFCSSPFVNTGPRKDFT